MPERTGCAYETLRDGLLQDLIAVRVIIGQAGPALPGQAEALRRAITEAGKTLDVDIRAVRVLLDRLREAEAA